MKWLVPIRVVEHGRTVIVEADSPSEARLKARAADWESCDDASHYDVTVVGVVTRIKDDAK